MRHIILGLLIAGCLAPAALGDILYMRDGRKIEGKIVFEANGVYHVEVSACSRVAEAAGLEG